MAKIQNHVENTIDNLRDSAGNAHEINAAYLDGKGAEEYVTQATLSIISSRVDTNEIADDVEHIPRIYTGETIREGQRKDDFFILEETGG